VINKSDFLIYFDSVLAYVDANEIVLEIRGEGEDDGYVIMTMSLYDELQEKIDNLKREIERMEKNA